MNSPANEQPLSNQISDLYNQERKNTKVLIKKLSITNVNNNIVMNPDQLKMIVENSENPSFAMDLELKNLSKQFKIDYLQDELKLDLEPILLDVEGIDTIHM